MYYELYVDSLFLINFVMNFYLLEIVNRTAMCTVTHRRVVAGAAVGAGMYLIPFFLSGPAWLKILVGFPAAAAAMIAVTFRVKSIKSFFRIAEKLLLYSFLLGGAILFVIRLLPQVREALVNVAGILGMGAIVFLVLSYHKEQKRKSQNLCKVVLVGKGVRIEVDALVDTGNGLVEPISGKPVSILEKSVFDGLWKEGKPEGYRAIPYHSIGKSRGVMQGYVVPEILVEVDGITKSCKDVYVGIGEGFVANENLYQLILNPQLLETSVKKAFHTS